MAQIGMTYAQGLYDLAKSEGLEQEILQQMNAMVQAFSQEPEYGKLLSSPNLSKQQRCQILEEGFRGKLQPYLLNFLKILTEKGYVRHFPDCCKAYREIYNRDHGILQVRAVSAVALNEDQMARLEEKLSQLTGKTVDLINRVDPGVLGGLRLDYDGKRVDGTVDGRLKAVGKLLKNTIL